MGPLLSINFVASEPIPYSRALCSARQPRSRLGRAAHRQLSFGRIKALQARRGRPPAPGVFGDQYIGTWPSPR